MSLTTRVKQGESHEKLTRAKGTRIGSRRATTTMDETVGPKDTTETIRQKLLAQGHSLDQIIMPGGSKDVIKYIAEDFDDDLNISFREAINLHKINVVNIELAHAESVCDLSSENHADPFDRMLAVQCLDMDIPLLSIDSKLDPYGVTRVW